VSLLVLAGLTVVVVLGLPFWLVTLGTRALAGRLEARPEPWQNIIEFESALGWKTRSNLRAHCLSEDLFRVETDAAGWRGRCPIAESDVVVIGDSFAWGYGVDEGQCFFNIPAGVRVAARGVVGYNMVQELLLLRRLGPSLAGKLVVWLIFLGNDPYENLMPHMGGYRMPFVRRGPDGESWEIVTSHLSPARWSPVPVGDGRVYYEKLVELSQPSFLTDRAFPAIEFLIGEGHSLCRHLGAALTMMTIPDPHQLSENGRDYLRSLNRTGEDIDVGFADRRIQEACRRLGVPVVPLQQHLTLDHYLTFDCHWNPAGHRRVATVLSDVWRTRAPAPGGDRGVSARTESAA
jgi:hypothetical protein